MTRKIQLIIADMAGTTISDDGVVLESFDAALSDAGVDPGSPRWVEAQRVVRETMGQSKIDVFRRVIGNEPAAQQAAAAFEAAYATRVQAGRVKPIDGAMSALALLRAQGKQIALTTGFSAVTRDLLLTQLAWVNEIDLALSPSDAGRGRPCPDMLWLAMLRLGARSVQQVVVVGDTPSDMQAGASAGIPFRYGVLTGAATEQGLRDAGATEVIASIAQLPERL